MSYDFEMLRVAEGETVRSVFTTLCQTSSENDPNPGPMHAEAEQRKRFLADALVLRRPDLEPFAFEYDSIANSEGVDELEARRRWRHVELNDESFGLQITLYDNYVSVTLPYWHEGEKAQHAFRAMWDCLEIIRTHAGYEAFDPQLDRAIDLSSDSDFQEVVQTYLRTKHAAEIAIERGSGRKAWWKFW